MASLATNTAAVAFKSSRPPSDGMTRRKLLNFVMAAPLAGAVLAAVPAAATAPPVVEDSELLRLGEALPAVAREARLAYLAERRVLAKWGPRWPLAPDEITWPGSIYSPAALERGLTGAALHRQGEEHPRRIAYTADHTRRELESLRKVLRRKRRDPQAPISYFGEKRSRDDWAPRIVELEARLEAATWYECETSRIKRESQYEAVSEREAASAKRLGELVDQIMARKPRTTRGLLIQAQALQAWSRIAPWRSTITSRGGHWAVALAQTVQRLN